MCHRHPASEKANALELGYPRGVSADCHLSSVPTQPMKTPNVDPDLRRGDSHARPSLRPKWRDGRYALFLRPAAFLALGAPALAASRSIASSSVMVSGEASLGMVALTSPCFT